MCFFMLVIFQGYELEDDNEKGKCTNNAGSMISSRVLSLVILCLQLVLHIVKAYQLQHIKIPNILSSGTLLDSPMIALKIFLNSGHHSTGNCDLILKFVK